MFVGVKANPEFTRHIAITAIVTEEVTKKDVNLVMMVVLLVGPKEDGIDLNTLQR